MKLDYRDSNAYPDSIPAGFASPGETIYIVDEQIHLLPPGLPGKIVIGGACIAAGYLNHEDLTKQSFIQNIFATGLDIRKGWTTMYRTKDRGRLLSDGCLLVEGRIGGDTEIELRGMRVDLRTDDRMPTTASSKLDRAAIAALPVRLAGDTLRVSRPLTTMELRVKVIWSEVLVSGLTHADSINAESDFFHVGGTSMLLIEVSSTLRAMAKLVEQNMETTDDILMEQYLGSEWGGHIQYEKLSIEELAARAEKEGLHAAVATVFANAESLGSLSFPIFVKAG
ncbi:hypothetical protein F4860DRAFT_509690 [Xylaria cubensis]|nr:hypothetical protein F4860DRAFT_509690 [Xylaria cubensis]